VILCNSFICFVSVIFYCTIWFMTPLPSTSLQRLLLVGSCLLWEKSPPQGRPAPQRESMLWHMSTIPQERLGSWVVLLVVPLWDMGLSKKALGHWGKAPQKILGPQMSSSIFLYQFKIWPFCSFNTLLLSSLHAKPMGPSVLQLEPPKLWIK
jgi:hypothetical protein